MKILGLDLDQTKINVTLLNKKKGKINFEEFRKFSSIEELDRYISLLSSKKDLYFISSIKTPDLLIKDIKIPFKKNKAVFQALPFQLESSLPYAINDAICQVQSKKTKEATLIKSFVITKKTLIKHLEELSPIQPHFVSSEPSCLFRVSKYLTNEESLLSIHLKERECIFCASLNNEIIAATNICFGYRDFFDKASLDLKNASEEDVKIFLSNLDLTFITQENFPHFYPFVELFKKDCDRAIYFLLNKKGARQIEKIFFSGSFDLLNSFSSHVENVLDFPLKVIQKDFADKEAAIRAFALSSGACLDILDEKKGLEFRGKENINNQLLEKLKKKILWTSISLVCFCLAVYFCGSYLLFQKEKLLENKLVAFSSKYAHQQPTVARKIKSGDLHFFQKLKLAKKTFSINQKTVKFYDEQPLLSLAMHEISSISDLLPDLSIEEFKFVLQDFPGINHPTNDYKIHMTLRILSESKADIDNFCDKLKKIQTFRQLSEFNIVNAEGNKYEIQFIYSS